VIEYSDFGPFKDVLFYN